MSAVTMIEKIAHKKDPTKGKVNCDIEDLIAMKEWEHLFVRLEAMKGKIPYSDRQAILKSDAPKALKCIAFICVVIPSC